MRLYFFISLFLISIIGNAQPGRAKEYSITDKKAIKLYEAGAASYNLLEFQQAEQSLDYAKARAPEFIEVYLLLSQIYNETKRPNESITALEMAMGINPNFFPTGFYFLGEMYLGTGAYQKSYSNFLTYLERSPRDELTIKRANLGVASCEFAEKAMKSPVDFDPKNIGPAVNTDKNEYYPCLTADEQSMLFTREIDNSQALNGKHEDFFVADKVNGEWDTSYNVREVNTLNNEGAPTLSPDGQVLIFTACENIEGNYGQGRNGLGSCDLFFSQKSGTRWSKPQNLGERINTYYWESQPSFSADGTTLYFVRGRRTGQGISKQDIYVSYLVDGQWQKATKIKGKVNTEFEEESVMIHPDGKTLYFSSNGHPGMGGLDIFYSKKQDDGQWGEPVNLGYPINTFNGENSLLVTANGKVAYFASDREGGYGGLDLYSFILPENVRPEPVTYAKGTVYDFLSFKKLGARFELIDLETGNIIVESYSNPENGEFLVCLPTEKDYALNVSKEGYIFYSENFSLKGYQSLEPFILEIPLSKIKVGNAIVLNNVFFATNEYTLKKESKVELDKLVIFLQQNPTLKVELSGHTDDVGSDSNNQVLSQNRSNSVVNYLVDHGANAGMITAKGYGETKPIADNKTEDGRAKNRRTEFEILGK